MISVEKPGSPSEILEHAGVRGMKWGVRKAVDTALGTKTSGGVKDTYKRYQSQTILGKRAAARAKMTPAARAAQTEHHKKIAKRIALGVAATAVVAGTAFVAYKLHQNNQIKMEQLRKAEHIMDHQNNVAEILANLTGSEIKVG